MQALKLKIIPKEEQLQVLDSMFRRWASLCTRMARKNMPHERFSPPAEMSSWFNKTQLNQLETDVRDHKKLLQQNLTQKEYVLHNIKNRLETLSEMIEDPSKRDVHPNKPNLFRPKEWVDAGLLKTKFNTIKHWQSEVQNLERLKERIAKTIERIKKGRIVFKPKKVSIHQNNWKVNFYGRKLFIKPFQNLSGIELDIITSPLQPARGSSEHSREYLEKSIKQYLRFALHSILFGKNRALKMLLQSVKPDKIQKRDAYIQKKKDEFPDKINDIKKLIGRNLTKEETDILESEKNNFFENIKNNNVVWSSKYQKLIETLADILYSKNDYLCLEKYPILIRKPTNRKKKIKNLKPYEWEYYIQLSYENFSTQEEFKPKRFLGIDRGLTHLLAISVFDPATNKFVFNKLIDNPVIGWKWKLRKMRRSLQRLERRVRAQKKHSLTRKKMKFRLRSIEDKIENFYHNISRQIINLAKKYQATIVLESLQNMKQHGRKKSQRLKNLNYALSLFDYHKIANFINYKAKNEGIPVYDILPAGTSQNCAKCLLENKEQSYQRDSANKKIGRCKIHGQIDADLNASRVIALCLFKNQNKPMLFGMRKVFKNKKLPTT